ncbi:MAG: GFA family protein [Pseudomonadota bacterium]
MSDEALPVDGMPLAGGCLCGAVRYEISATPMGAAYCHCRLCRRASGAPVVAWLSLKAADLRYSAGAPRQFQSSSWARREFCGACGTPLAFRFRQKGEEYVDVTVGSLDRPQDIRPGLHIYTDSALPWLVIDDGLKRLPRHGAGFAPDGFGAA